MLKKKDEIFDLEQAIFSCWQVTNDIDTLNIRVGDTSDFDSLNAAQTDKLMNILMGIREVYEQRFESLWREFEGVTYNYHRYRKAAEEFL